MKLTSTFHLGVKELRSLLRDPMMMFLIVFSFTISIYMSATAQPESLQDAVIAIVDQDQSPLSERIRDAFYPPYFLPPRMISQPEIDPGLDAGDYTFALYIPAGFQRDVRSGQTATVQLNTDATSMSQAFTGSGYIQAIIAGEVAEYIGGSRRSATPPVELATRARFNPGLKASWFGSVMEIINNVTMLSIVLTGAALIREREHGTIEHLLVMPVTPLDIMAAKVWSMALVVLLACSFSLAFVVEGLLRVPIEGSILLFLAGASLHLFATTSMGIFMATVARSMPQFGLLLMLVLMPLQMLSGGSTPRESMPDLVQQVMLIAPTTHFVSLSQAVLYRGAGLEVVWPQLLMLGVIGALFFGIASARFRTAIVSMA